MIRYFVRTLGAHFRAGRSLYLLTVFGVALGVASVLSIQIINRNAMAAFSGSMQAVSGDADLTILSRSTAIDEAVYVDVLATRGVASAWPLYRTHVSVATRQRFFLELIGFDLYAPARIPIQTEVPDPTSAIDHPGWVAVTPALAREMGWAVGDSVDVTSGTRRVHLVIGSLVDFQRITPFASRKLAVMDIAQAQSLFGSRGHLNQIDVRAREDIDPVALRDRLQRRLGPSVEVVTPDQRQRQAAGLLEAFRLNLTALSFISVLVGLFLVYSSTQAALVRRRVEFGILRSLGTSRSQLAILILGEIAMLGALGVIIGVPLGYWGAAANVDVVSATLTNLYLLHEIETLELPRWLFGVAALVGIGGALGGALGPILDMSRRDPNALLAAFTRHEKMRSSAPQLWWAGVALLAGTVGWYAAVGREWRPSGFVLAASVVVAVPLLTPLVVHQIASRAPVQVFGWGYSLRTLGVRLQTTSVAVAALGIAVSMLIGITLMIGSFRKTLDRWMEASVRADVYVTTESGRGLDAEATLGKDVIGELAAYPGVRAVDRLRTFLGYAGERRIRVAGVDIGFPGGETRFSLLPGSLARPFELMRNGAVFVSEPLARKMHIEPGDTLRLAGPRRAIPFPVAGVYYDYSSESGAVTMALQTLERHYGPGQLTSAAVYLDADRDAETVVDELRDRFAPLPLLIRSNVTLRRQALHIFDQTFAVTRLLQAMSLLIAVTGITLTLLVLARERVSELALYKALGADRFQIFRVFVGKGLGMSAVGLTIGLGGGVLLAAILIRVINRAYFGWTIQASFPLGPVALQIATILLAATAATIYPATRASRVLATELSRENV